MTSSLWKGDVARRQTTHASTRFGHTRCSGRFGKTIKRRNGDLIWCLKFNDLRTVGASKVYVPIFAVNPLECKSNYSATSNNMKLVHWPLIGQLLHLVQRAVDRCVFGCPPEREVLQLLWSAAAWLPGNCTHLAGSFQQTVDASKFQSLVGKFTQQASCTILLVFDQNRILLWKFHVFVLLISKALTLVLWTWCTATWLSLSCVIGLVSIR